MRAPIDTIEWALRLGKPAIERVLRELDAGKPESVLHFNGRPPLGSKLDQVAIRRAVPEAPQ
jgi:hypothetical protein